MSELRFIDNNKNIFEIVGDNGEPIRKYIGNKNDQSQPHDKDALFSEAFQENMRVSREGTDEELSAISKIVDNIYK